MPISGQGQEFSFQRVSSSLWAVPYRIRTPLSLTAMLRERGLHSGYPR
jgi:hypothetical protein